VRSESPASPPADRPFPRPAGRRIVPIAEAVDGLRSFSSEKPEVASQLKVAARSATEDGSLAAFASELPVKEAAIVRPVRQIGWREIALAVLALLAVAQGGLIAYWFAEGRAAAPPESGTVSITSEPPGSPVSVDGVSQGATPLKVPLSPGPHRFEVGSGASVRTQTINVTRGGDASLHIELPHPIPASGVSLAPGMGGLQIATDPAGAQVWIDGELRGAAPLSASNLKPGEHTVVVKASGDAVNRTVTIQEAAVASLIISMNSKSAFASGWLSISSAIPLQVIEKGTLLGSTEAPRILLSTGSHDLELANATLGYRTTRTVQVGAGQTTSIAVTLPQGALSINALPWAEVWIAGERIGETPIANISRRVGTYEVVFRHPQLGERRENVVITLRQPLRLGVDMRGKQQ
jgi:PEGA domain